MSLDAWDAVAVPEKKALKATAIDVGGGAPDYTGINMPKLMPSATMIHAKYFGNV